MGYGPWALLFLALMTRRTVGLVDGFNLYHAIRDLQRDSLKWLDLRRLLLSFAPAPDYTLSRVLYFSAYATWLPGPERKHRTYVAALQASGVEPRMGRFKVKLKECKLCKGQFTSHEEKETDVSIGAHLIDLAHSDAFDVVLLVTADSDLCPAVRLVRQRFPKKEIRILTPPGRPPGGELLSAAGCRPRIVKLVHLERSLFPERVLDATGRVVAVRPPDYLP